MFVSKPHLLSMLALGITAGCASRSVPAHFPEQAAATPTADGAPRAKVTRSLSADPPLPGEPGSEAFGSATPRDAAARHEHHGAHHGH